MKKVEFSGNPLTKEWFLSTKGVMGNPTFDFDVHTAQVEHVNTSIEQAVEYFLNNIPATPHVRPWDTHETMMNQLWPTYEGSDGRNLVTLFEGQWVDSDSGGQPAEYPANLDGLRRLVARAKEWGFEGIELAQWRYDAERLCTDEEYVREIDEIFGEKEMLKRALSCHCVGQGVCDNIDYRHKAILPDYVWGDGNPYGVNLRCAMAMMQNAYAAMRLDVNVVNGFTGSPIWHLLYGFPPVPQSTIDAGFQIVGRRFKAILKVFRVLRRVFALEAHPTEIAYDHFSANKILEAIDFAPEFGFNFDPSHLIWQGVDPPDFIRSFAMRIYHVHDKDCLVRKLGRRGILGSHLPFGDDRRGWDFVSGGHGNVNFRTITRALNDIGYRGPRSTEWEDSGMERDQGAPETLDLVRASLFGKSDRRFDAGMETK
jgi:sugar phosphate isomerase/epimerase